MENITGYASIALHLVTMVAVMVILYAAWSAMNRLLTYLSVNKEERFLELSRGGGRHFPTVLKCIKTHWYMFSSKDAEDEAVSGYKAAYRNVMLVAAMLIISLSAIGALIHRM